MLVVGVIVWSFLVAISSSSVYWRDGGEFVLAAFYLDISHPAGFPLYSSLANAITLLPFGQIAWRVNLFSTTCSTIVVIGAYWISWRLLTNLFFTKAVPAYLYSALVVPILLGSVAFLHQSGTAEVYVLNALVFEILLALYLEYRITLRNKKEDVRFLYSSAFIAGIGLGNHVSLAGPLVVAFLVILTDWKKVVPILHVCALFFFVGLSIYLYLPLRASQPVPLRTGSPTTIARFLSLITDARDRNLKVATGPTLKQESVMFAGIMGNTTAEIKKLSNEIAPWLLGIGVVGVFFLGRRDLRLATLLVGSFFTTWFFFYGWQPFPWIPLFIVIALGVPPCVAVVTAKFSKNNIREAGLITACMLVIWLITLPERERIKCLSNLNNYDMPLETARRVVSSLPEGAVYLTESSWFLLAYVRFIEQFRPDITLVYQPRVLFPEFFEPVGSTLKIVRTGTTESGEVDLGALGSLLVAHKLPFGFEPSVTINSFVKDVAFVTGEGNYSISRTVLAGTDEAAAEGRLKSLNPLLDDIRGAHPLLADDARAYLETILVNEADMLAKMGRIDLALRLYDGACNRIHPRECSPGALTNIQMLRENQR